MAYKMTHPASDLEIEADASAVAMYESQGWETSPNAKPPTEGDAKK
jgi:hypothetical protein